MEIQYGCECNDSGCQAHKEGKDKAPLVAVVKRGDATLRVCPTCLWDDDIIIEFLFDGTSNVGILLSYDFIGAIYAMSKFMAAEMEISDGKVH